ncbi:MAG TPA: hypothetical protein VMX94_10500 [Armatimonadota bacterium]|nr:hypothetical protein [Armatimonadota bacterium]
MPIAIGRKQSIEELTDGRIKKKAREKAAQPARPRAEAARKAGEMGK